MKLPRSSGILLHPTSLPSRHGIGDLGEAAYRFVDFLVDSGQQWWQLMPLGPTGYGDSPYQNFSAFAGNPLLLSLEWLVSAGWLDGALLESAPTFPTDRVDFGPVQSWKRDLLAGCYARFREGASDEQRAQYLRFGERNAAWLDDYAHFMALKDRYSAVWNEWPTELRLRDGNALAESRGTLADEIGNHRLLQFFFDQQWRAVRQYANDRGVQLIGDIPIFVAYDSSDVWANPELFQLDDEGNPTVVAGVPPDYFSETGQRWGNPLYNWEAMERDGFTWWLSRIRRQMEQVDVLRLDHFRGFESYWEIPASEETAINGRWVKAPGEALFSRVAEVIGHVPIIAENLGLITPPVEALRKQFEFPGMRVMQFAFDQDPANPHLPHNYRVNTVAYTGTHDNDTSLGWWNSLDADAKHEVLRYLGRHHLPPLRIVPQLIRQVMRSVAAVAITPMQDVLNLGSGARMNTPGASSGNWGWRFEYRHLTGHLSRWLYETTELYGRLPGHPSRDD